MKIEDLEHNPYIHAFYDARDQLKRHIEERSERAFAAGEAIRDAISSREDLEVYQRMLRERLVALLGGLPPSDAPLNARITGEVQGNGFRVEKVIFESRPGNYVTANLYLPDGLNAPTAAVMFLCGHAREAKHYAVYQAVCQRLALAGLVVFAQDPIGQGERLSYYDPDRREATVRFGTIEHDYAGAQCLMFGHGLARYFLHDAMRGLDYLLTRPEVDSQRIGVTGSSGGGTQTCLMMLADPRIAAAAPGTFVTSRQAKLYTGCPQDAEQIWPGYTAAGYDHEDALIAMAPRPVTVLAVTGDFFPIEGTRRTVARARRAWDLCGCPERLDLVEDESSHAYTPALARAAARFFSRYLLGEERCPADADVVPFEPSRLWCTSSGQGRGELPGAVSVHEANLEEASRITAEKATASLPERRAAAIAWLRERVERERVPCDLNPRIYARAVLDDLDVEMAFWWAQQGLLNHGYLFRLRELKGSRLPVTLALWDGGTTRLSPHLDWLKAACAAGRAVLVLNTTAAGAIAPRPTFSESPGAFHETWHRQATDLLWLDDDIPSLRTYDVLRALDVIPCWPGLDSSDITVYTHGRHGLYGRLAALLDSRIGSVEVGGDPGAPIDWATSRHYDSDDIYSVVMHGMLRHLDPDVLESF
jgi:dienelactone hydrolase